MQSRTTSERIRTLAEELIISTSRKQSSISEEDMLFSINCLLRAFETLLDEEQNWEYAETKFYAAYNLLTGRTVYPS